MINYANPWRSRTASLTISIGCTLLLALSLAACGLAQPTSGPVQPTNSPAQPTAGPAGSTSRPSPTAQSAATSTVLPDPTATPQPASTLAVAPAGLQGLTIQFWHPWDGAAGQTVAGLAQAFNDANEWGIRVEPVSAGDYDALSEQVLAAVEAGDPPDLAAAYLYQAQTWEGLWQTGVVSQTVTITAEAVTTMTASAATQEPVVTASAVPSTLLVDLATYVNDPIWGLSPAEQADFLPAFWEAGVVGGRRIGLPALQSAQLLFYNRSWAGELGFAGPPGTPAELRSQACAAAEAYRQDDDPQNDGRGGLIFSTHPAALAGWMAAFGGDITPGESGYRFDSPETRQALHFLRELYDAGCAWLPESEPDVAGFAGRQGLFAAGGLAELPFLARAFDRSQNPDEWTVLPFPSPQGEAAIAAYGPSFVILESDPERQLAAWLFLKWLAAPESQARLAAASGLLPVRQAALEPITGSSELPPQYTAALDLLPYARPEPSYASWDTVRWAVSDAGVQLTRYYFTIDQVPALVELLDETARELHARTGNGQQ